MSDHESLSDVLSGKESTSAPVVETKGETAAPPAVETKAETPTETKAETKSEAESEKPQQTRDESGKFAKVEEKPADKPAEKTRPDVAAIIDERRKRQALEKQLAELTAQKPQAKPSVF